MLKILASIGFFVMGLVQLWAMFDYFASYLHWSGLFSGIAAFVVAYIPFVGGIVGTIAAIKVWHWEWWLAVLLFFWPYLFFALALISGRAREPE